MNIQIHAFRNIFSRLGRLSLMLLLCGVVLSGCRWGQSSEESNPQLRKAKKLIEQGNFEAAFVELNQALNEAPKDPNVHLNLGWLYLYTDDIEASQKELAKAEGLGPDLAETYHLKGALLNYKARKEKDNQRMRQLEEEAIQNFRQSLQRNDQNNQTYFDLATSLMAVNKNEEALDALDKGFDRIPPKDLEMQVNYQIASCDAHARLQLYEDAIEDCQQALTFTTNPASRDRIEEMIENMKLLNPGLSQKLDAIQSQAKQASEETAIDEANTD